MELPLFPLNTVLCPGIALPLHIFEERYRALVRHCIDTTSPFGVVLKNNKCRSRTGDDVIGGVMLGLNLSHCLNSTPHFAGAGSVGVEIGKSFRWKPGFARQILVINCPPSVDPSRT